MVEYPCKDCKDREIGCHGKCKAYADAKAKHSKVNKTRRKYLEGFGKYDPYVQD